MKKNRFMKTSVVLSTIVAIILFTMPYSSSASAGTWVKKASMHTARFNMQTEVIDGILYAIGGHNGTTALSTVEAYNPVSNAWTVKASMNEPRELFQTAVVDNKIYAIGGTHTGGYTSSAEVYDPITDKWTPIVSMSVPRCHFEAQVIGGKIYAMGGITTGGTILSSAEVYDPNTNKWAPIAPMSNGRYGFQSQVINNNIYVISGNTTNTIEAYDPALNTWTIKAKSSTIRSFFRSEVIDGKIYILGGCNSYTVFSSAEVFDPVANTLTSIKSMSDSRTYFRTAVLNNKLYVFGGRNSEGESLSSAEVYDPVTNLWTAISFMSFSKCTLSSEIIDGTIYAIGGQNDDNGSTILACTEAYSIQSPSFTVTPSSDKVTLGNQFTTTVAIHNASNICAEDIKLTYDSSLFDFVSATAKDGQKLCTADSSVAGTVRLINASQGIENAATGDKDLITLTFKAKAVGTGKIDITKGRIADNATLEEDVADENCGECSVTVETSKDVNRSGEVTLLDLGIDAGYYGKNASDTDSTKYDADVVPDGKIDGQDLDAIDKALLGNSNYGMNK